METIKELLLSIPWYAWIAIVAILSSATVQLVRMTQRHDERMALIESGQRPDQETR